MLLVGKKEKEIPEPPVSFSAAVPPSCFLAQGAEQQTVKQSGKRNERVKGSLSETGAV